MLDVTRIPEDRTHFQLTVTANELSMLSLGVTGIFSLVRGGPSAAARDLSMGLMAMIMNAGGEVSDIRDAVNGLCTKLNALVEDINKGAPNGT